MPKVGLSHAKCSESINGKSPSQAFPSGPPMSFEAWQVSGRFQGKATLAHRDEPFIAGKSGCPRCSYPEFALISLPYPCGLQVRFLQKKIRMRAAQPQEAHLNHLTRWYNPPPCRNNRIRLEIPRAQSSARHAKMGMSVMPPVATVPPELSRHLHSHPNRYQNEAQTCA